jgi:hypothetical protein
MHPIRSKLAREMHVVELPVQHQEADSVAWIIPANLINMSGNTLYSRGFATPLVSSYEDGPWSVAQA